jgi:2-amino-4-hydroxy-6-hydroxymethyldihydropteridine diphosphokinase
MMEHDAMADDAASAASSPVPRASAVQACIGLGANLGNAAASLTAAFERLGGLPQTQLLAASRLYRTPAWGLRDQPDFVNAAALVRTQLPAPELLRALLAIERDFGRQRAADGSDRWGPRSLDLDLLLYGDAVIDMPGLQVPHPQLHRRAFVLVPLCAIAPDLAIPGLGRAHDLLAALGGDEVAGVQLLDA